MVTFEVHFRPLHCTDICSPLWFFSLAQSAVWKNKSAAFSESIFWHVYPGLHYGVRICTAVHVCWVGFWGFLELLVGLIWSTPLSFSFFSHMIEAVILFYLSVYIYILYICILIRARILALLILLRLSLGRLVAQNTHRTNFRQWHGPKVMVRRQAASAGKGKKDSIFSRKPLCITWRRRVCKLHDVKKKRIQRTMCILAGMYTL